MVLSRDDKVSRKDGRRVSVSQDIRLSFDVELIPEPCLSARILSLTYGVVSLLTGRIAFPIRSTNLGPRLQQLSTNRQKTPAG